MLHATFGQKASDYQHLAPYAGEEAAAAAEHEPEPAGSAAEYDRPKPWYKRWEILVPIGIVVAGAGTAAFILKKK